VELNITINTDDPAMYETNLDHGYETAAPTVYSCRSAGLQVRSRMQVWRPAVE
jgi:hypothetical protein